MEARRPVVVRLVAGERRLTKREITAGRAFFLRPFLARASSLIFLPSYFTRREIRAGNFGQFSGLACERAANQSSGKTAETRATGTTRRRRRWDSVSSLV